MKFPSRNVMAGGLAASLVWLGCAIAGAHGVTIDDATQTALVIGVGFALTHFVPRQAQDIIAELNDGIVQMAQADPNSDVSYVLPPAHVPPGEPAMIGGPPTIGGMAQLALPPPAPADAKAPPLLATV